MGFDPEKAVEHLKKELDRRSIEIPAEFDILQTRLIMNRQEARRWGETSDRRSECNSIIDVLNDISRKLTGKALMDWGEKASLEAAFTSSKQKSTSSEASSDSSPDEYLGRQRRWALLVGVSVYEDSSYSPLPVCQYDAKELAQQLSQSESGFTPESLHILTEGNLFQPTQMDIVNVLQRMSASAREDDLLLFYYSGHGELERDEGYLVTKDTIFGSLSETALSLKHIQSIIKESRAGANVIILDACHVGAAGFRKGGCGLPPAFFRRVYQQAFGTIILTSCQEEEQSHVWPNRQHSAYTYFLIDALKGHADRDRKGFVSVEDIDAHVTNGMAAWTERFGYRQTPRKYADTHGRIIVSYYKPQTEEQGDLP